MRRQHVDGAAEGPEQECRAYLAAGPTPPTPAELAAARYALTDLLDDLADAPDPELRTASAVSVWQAAAELRLLVAGGWWGSGKWLVREPRLLILDDPTIGVDIGAKSEIVATVRAMADRGTAVLVISSELEELMAISDRILVLHAGRIAQDLNRRTVASEEELHHAIQGHGLRAAAAIPA